MVIGTIDASETAALGTFVSIESFGVVHSTVALNKIFLRRKIFVEYYLILIGTWIASEGCYPLFRKWFGLLPGSGISTSVFNSLRGGRD